MVALAAASVPAAAVWSGNFEMLEAEAEFTNICAVRTSYITPRAAKNKEGQFRFIVNSPDGAAEYSQLVRVAVCGAAGAECSGGARSSWWTPSPSPAAAPASWPPPTSCYSDPDPD